MTTFSMFTWLVHSALACSVILICGAVAAGICRQPADRLRVIQWSLRSCLLAMLFVCWPSFSVLSLSLLKPVMTSTESSVTVATEAAALSTATNPFAPLLVDAVVLAPDTSLADDPVAQPRPAANRDAQFFHKATTAPAKQFHARALAIRTVVGSYLTGVLLLALRWGRASARLKHIRQNAKPAPDTSQVEFERIAGAASKHVSLLTSSKVTAPIVWGLMRPVIVLPELLCEVSDRTKLRYCLAHEWAHVLRRDIATWHLATLLQFVLYYQPVFWWLRHRLAISMDQLADAVASDQGPSTPDYAAYLVELARRQFALPALSLCISDKGSRLRQRVECLLESTSPLRPTCPRSSSLMIAATAIGLGTLASTVRLDARPSAEAVRAESKTESVVPSETVLPVEEKNPPPVPGPADDGEAVESITYTGRVEDRVSGQPIEGVKVLVHRKLSRDPKTGGWTTLGMTEHVTNELGIFSFVIPPEQAAEDSLYLEVEAHHPNYAAKGRSGYSHAMIRKNLTVGEQPFYSRIRLWPGEAITGLIVSPTGEPLDDVEISMYSAADGAKGFPAGSFDKTYTNERGEFSIVPATPGDGVLWIKPERFAPQAHRLGDRRGNWGTLTLQEGATIAGRLLDAKGNPVAGVRIEARRRGDGEEADDFLNNNAVANQIGREAITGSDGQFTLAALPDGDYRLRFRSAVESYDPPPLEQVFLQQRIAIEDGVGLSALEIRAVPHVVIQAKYLNSKGKPRSGHEVMLFGRMDDESYFAQSTQPGKDGKLHLKAPHGLQQVYLDLITNEHSALRWRLSADKPLNRGRHIRLGTLEEDITGIEIVRYVAPIVLIKPVDEQGQLIEECNPKINYVRENQALEEMSVYTTGSHVSFEHQQDGRWRSSQALPDELMRVTVEKKGYSTTPQELSLAEGEKRELLFVMTKDARGEE